MTTNILIVYHSKHGNTHKMAKLIARGVESIEGACAVLRSVPPLDTTHESTDPIVSPQDLIDCHGMILGSPAHFGNMATAVKSFIDNTGNEWFSGTLIDKPGAVFTSSSSLHGGQETTLLTMMLPLLHHGMMVLGLPYSEKSLLHTESGGTPYGASHWSGINSDRSIDKNEKNLCLALGKRVAKTALQLSNNCHD